MASTMVTPYRYFEEAAEVENVVKNKPCLWHITSYSFTSVQSSAEHGVWTLKSQNYSKYLEEKHFQPIVIKNNHVQKYKYVNNKRAH